MLRKSGFLTDLWKDSIAGGSILLELEHFQSQENAFKDVGYTDTFYGG